MTTLEPWTVGDVHNSEYQSATAATLSAGLDTLTAFRNVVEATDVGVIFESLSFILNLVKVRFLTLCPSLYPLTGDTTRTR